MGVLRGAVEVWGIVKRCFRPPQSELKRLAVAMRGDSN
jgi:hypothetical protein